VIDHHGDVAGSLHFEKTFAAAQKVAQSLEADLAVGERVEVELWRDELRGRDLVDRQFAIVRGFKLPARFSGGASIADHFRAEIVDELNRTPTASLVKRSAGR
jgi:hypothetical protein